MMDALEKGTLCFSADKTKPLLANLLLWEEPTNQPPFWKAELRHNKNRFLIDTSEQLDPTIPKKAHIPWGF